MAVGGKKFCPVYSYKSPKFGENLFIIPRKEFMAHTLDRAYYLASDVEYHEGRLYGFRYTGKVIEFESKIPFVKANIKTFPIAVIEGDVYDLGLKNSMRERAEAN